MIKEFRYAYIIRRKFIDLVQTLSLDQLNKIPEGFNNNIAWHFGHLVVGTEMLCYVRSEVMPDKNIEFAYRYKTGTKPENFIGREEIDYFISQMLSSLDSIEQDYQNGIFQLMKPYTTLSFGFGLNTIEDVFECCAYHDTVHFGTVMAMRKLV